MVIASVSGHLEKLFSPGREEGGLSGRDFALVWDQRFWPLHGKGAGQWCLGHFGKSVWRDLAAGSLNVMDLTALRSSVLFGNSFLSHTNRANP